MKDYLDDTTTKSEEIWVTNFDTESAITFKKQLFESFDKDSSKPIVININSDGGSVDGLFLMLDAIDSIRSIAGTQLKIITAASGRAMSAAAVLLSHGDVRFASRNTTIMVHEVASGFWGTKADLDVEIQEIDRINTQVLQILVENCKLSGGLAEAKALFNRNAYLTPEKAKKINLIDIVGYPKIQERRLYELVVCSPDEDFQKFQKKVNNKKAKK